jgi:hypothetical protein
MIVDPLVAGRLDQPAIPWAGVWIAEDIELIAQGVRGGSWVDGTLGVVGAGLDGLALVSDRSEPCCSTASPGRSSTSSRCPKRWTE